MNTIICGHCTGTGETASTELYRGRRCTTWCRCTKCQGVGTVEAPTQPEPPADPATVPVAEVLVAVAQVESREEALRRLLVVARESGVQLKRDSHGDMWATSVSEPGRLYRVDPDSCGCRGFQAYRHCRHVAALWAHLGFLDEPEVIDTVTLYQVNDRDVMPVPASVATVEQRAA
jgi:hypothetical protein